MSLQEGDSLKQLRLCGKAGCESHALASSCTRDWLIFDKAQP